MASFDVLYAEDEFTNRKLLEIQLTKAGLKVDLASDGLQAVNKFQNNTYKVIILDQYMPGMNGDDLAKVIHGIDPHMPLIAITSDDSETQRLKEVGFSDVFIKPLRGTEYIDAIIKLLKDKK